MAETATKQPSKKLSESKKLDKRYILFGLVILLVLALAATTAVYFVRKNAKKPVAKNTAATQTDSQPTKAQPSLSQPNAGRVSGKALEDEISQAKKDAATLAAQVAAVAAPQNQTEQIALAKKNLELGKLYYKAMQYQEALAALAKVTAGSPVDVADAQATMAKVSVNIGNKSLAITYYNQAIKTLESISNASESVKIDVAAYKEAVKALES